MIVTIVIVSFLASVTVALPLAARIWIVRNIGWN